MLKLFNIFAMLLRLVSVTVIIVHELIWAGPSNCDNS